MRNVIPFSVALSCLVLIRCGDGDSNTAPTATTTTAPRIVTTEFTLSSPDCTFSYSRPVKRLSVGESFTVRFKPLSVDDVEGSEWANSVEFWLDRIDQDQRDAIALVFSWAPNSRWFVDFFTDQEGFRGTGRRELINVNGDFREITVVRADGLSEWLLDGVVILQLADTKPERTVYTRVVGSDALFQYEEVATSVTETAASLSADPDFCIVPGPPVCIRTVH